MAQQSASLINGHQPYLIELAHTLILFTWTDYKTIFIPITTFAAATAPLHTPSKLVQGCFWIWIHLVLCNVSNQVNARVEDAINRPWRPIPSGRVTESQAYFLRWAMVVVCVMWSALYGSDLVFVTLGLVVTTLFYDEGGLAGHWVGKNLCGVGGYTSFELGATKIMGFKCELDDVSLRAVLLSGMIIFTTLQAQDFPDVEGDIASNRVTFPIYAPEFSRIFTLIIIPMWSILLSWSWNIGNLSRFIYVGLGGYVGLRYYCLRRQDSDRRSYLLYNVWLMISHILPVHARTGILSI